MKEECVICGAQLEYLDRDEMMECAICHKKENSKTRCVNGHYVCNWGACGAGISTGMFISIISGSTPLTQESFALSHQMTAKSLGEIGRIGGPRCCKRDSFLSILSAIDFVEEHFAVRMEKPEVICTYSSKNNQCIGKRCPFARVNHRAYDREAGQ